MPAGAASKPAAQPARQEPGRAQPAGQQPGRAQLAAQEPGAASGRRRKSGAATDSSGSGGSQPGSRALEDDAGSESDCGGTGRPDKALAPHRHTADIFRGLLGLEIARTGARAHRRKTQQKATGTRWVAQDGVRRQLAPTAQRPRSFGLAQHDFIQHIKSQQGLAQAHRLLQDLPAVAAGLGPAAQPALIDLAADSDEDAGKGPCLAGIPGCVQGSHCLTNPKQSASLQPKLSA